MPADDESRALALAGIDAAALVVDLTRSPAGGGRIPFSALYAYALDAGFRPPAGWLERLAGEAQARADIDALLARRAWDRLPRLAAASSGEITRRETRRATLTVIPSRAAPEQVFLVVEMRDPEAQPPATLVVMDQAGQLHRQSLGPFQAGRAQVPLLYETPLIRALAEPDVVVFLIR